MTLLSIGNSENTSRKQFLLDNEEELQDVPDCSPGSTVIILTDSGMIVKMKNSKGEWMNL